MSNEEDEDLSVVAQRNFFMMLSPGDGAAIASMAGFSPTSPDVRDAEKFDNIAKWILLASTGIVKHIEKTADWLSVLIDREAEDDEEGKAQAKAVYLSYGVALLSYLVDEGMIELCTDGEPLENLSEFAGVIPEVFSVFLVDRGEDEEEEEMEDDD